jgi:segregation and condensation protein A
MLYQREMVENAVWSIPGNLPFEETEVESQVAVSLFDLLRAFRDVIKRAEERPMMELEREEFSIEQMMGYLFENINAARGPITLTELLPAISTRRGLITAFLALLELTRLKAIFLFQQKPFDDISARANPNYELSKSFSPA